MVAHHVLHVAHGELAVGFHPQRQRFAFAFQNPGQVAVHAVGILVVERPHAAVAAAERAHVGGCVGLREAEILVLAVEVTLRACKVYHILRVDGVAALVGQREGVDAGMVGVARDAVVGHAARYPHGSLVGFSFAYEFHYPHLVGVGYGEAFARGGVSVFIHQVCHHLEGLAGGLGAFQAQENQRAVVNKAGAVQLRSSAPGAFGYHESVLVHVAHAGVGVGYLGYLAHIFAGVPFGYLAHRAGCVVGGGAVVELAVERVAVGGIGGEH